MRLGIDLGGTKIAAVVLDRHGRVVWERRVPTPRQDYAGTVAAIAALVAEAEREHGGRVSVGIGIPGTTSPATGLIKNANSTWLIGKPFHQDLERALGREVRLANDANCLAVSEAADGAAAGAAVVFGVIIGTGCGGGLVAHGRVLVGPNGIAGEWGHNSLPWPEAGERPGPACYCGQNGCIETFLSGPGIAADYRRRGGPDSTSEAIFARAGREPLAAATLRAWTRRLAKSLASIINTIDPDVIVVGGGLSRVAGIYRDVPAQWGAWVFSDTVDTRFVAAEHGDASGVRGAAWLWPEAGEAPGAPAS